MLRWKRESDRSIFDDDMMAIVLVFKQLTLGFRFYISKDVCHNDVAAQSECQFYSRLIILSGIWSMDVVRRLSFCRIKSCCLSGS